MGFLQVKNGTFRYDVYGGHYGHTATAAAAAAGIAVGGLWMKLTVVI